MDTQHVRTAGFVAIIMLVLVGLLATLHDATAKPAGGDSIDDRVSTNEWLCEFTGGTFTSGGWSVPGEQLGTLDVTAFSTCDHGDGDVTTCYDTATTQTCVDSMITTPAGRGEVTPADEAFPGDAMPLPVTPVPGSRG